MLFITSILEDVNKATIARTITMNNTITAVFIEISGMTSPVYAAAAIPSAAVLWIIAVCASFRRIVI